MSIWILNRYIGTKWVCNFTNFLTWYIRIPIYVPVYKWVWVLVWDFVSILKTGACMGIIKSVFLLVGYALDGLDISVLPSLYILFNTQIFILYGYKIILHIFFYPLILDMYKGVVPIYFLQYSSYLYLCINGYQTSYLYLYPFKKHLYLVPVYRADIMYAPASTSIFWHP